MPVDFNQNPRGLSDIDRWKVTKLRSFVLYTGPVVLQNSIQIQMYENSMLFFIAIHLLLSSGTLTATNLLLQQVVKRLSEMPNPESPKPHKCNLSQLHFDGPVLHNHVMPSHGNQFRKAAT